MKTIQTIKYINMFTKTNDHNIEYLIDLTVVPYCKQDKNIKIHIKNICSIIYEKSLSYGFNKLQSIEFSKSAAYDHLIKMNITDIVLRESIIKD